MNISALKRSFRRGSQSLTVASRKIFRPSTERQALRLLARAEREERRIRERIDLVQSWRQRAKALMGVPTSRPSEIAWPSPTAEKGSK